MKESEKTLGNTVLTNEFVVFLNLLPVKSYVLLQSVTQTVDSIGISFALSLSLTFNCSLFWHFLMNYTWSTGHLNVLNMFKSNIERILFFFLSYFWVVYRKIIKFTALFLISLFFPFFHNSIELSQLKIKARKELWALLHFSFLLSMNTKIAIFLSVTLIAYYFISSGLRIDLTTLMQIGKRIRCGLLLT